LVGTVGAQVTPDHTALPSASTTTALPVLPNALLGARNVEKVSAPAGDNRKSTAVLEAPLV
jgi:hypothetical protein